MKSYKNLLWEESCSASKNTCPCPSSSAFKEINNIENLLSEITRLLNVQGSEKKIIKLTHLLILKYKHYVVWNAGDLNFHAIYSSISLNCYSLFLREEGEEF